MADVGARDRGQLILVAALSLAILFVALALILNTAIYTENLATRSSDIGGGTDAVRYHDAALNSVGGTIDYANAHNNSTHATLRANLTAGVDSFENNSARLFAAGDRAVETNLEVTVNGTRVGQNNASRNFTNATGSNDWMIAQDVINTRRYTINLSTNNLLDSGAPLGDQFTVEIDNGTNQWLLYVYNDSMSSDIIVEVDSPSGGGGTCSVPGASQIWVNVTAGTVAGTECEYLTFAEGLTGDYTVSYQNADNVTGTYGLIIDNANLANSPGPHLFNDGSGQPFAAHAIYSANVTVVYQSPRLYYNTTVRVAPGESDG